MGAGYIPRGLEERQLGFREALVRNDAGYARTLVSVSSGKIAAAVRTVAVNVHRVSR